MSVELVLYTEKDAGKKLMNILLKDYLVSKGNVIFRDAGILGKSGIYIRIIGSEEQHRRALELAKDLAVEVKGEEKEKVLRILRSEDEKMLSDFSGIF